MGNSKRPFFPLRNPKALASAAGVVLLVGTVLVLWGRSHGGAVDFNRDVRPVLNERCLTCHGGIKQQGGFSLLFREDALDTTDSGVFAIVPGDPGASELVRRITHSDPEERMPPEGPPLTDGEVDVLRRWVRQGAAWEPHWAYVPPQRRPLPKVSDPAWPRSDLDHFVLARLDSAGLSPSPRTDCAVLLRRLSLDLVGLPPTPEEADAFCRDPSPEAYEREVDRLLASPHFGERWAALWLDLARYADSQGYEKDLLRSIWRYRDWVIDAFNRDLPFDRFTVEQLAGDLLPEAGRDQLLATAFHRNTMTNDEGGTDDEEFRLAAVIDRVNTTWEVWQGTTMACVQCHSHPYDPFRHEEYYRTLAFFNNTEDADRRSEAPVLYEFSEPDSARGRALLEDRHRVEDQIEALSDTPEQKRAYTDWSERLRAYAALPSRPPTFEDRTVPPDVLRIAARADSLRDGSDRARLKEVYLATAPAFADLRQRQDELEDELRALEPTTTPILRELPPGRQRTTHVFDRGNWLVRGAAVAPGVPASMPPLPAEAPRDRLGFARWLVSPENPLTARVTVNRFWEQLFGTGIVETVEDFGTQGAPPSHPGLLDHLALQFVHEHGWSVKGLLKSIVLSATYQQTSRVTPEGLERDPDNRLLARGPRFRLSAEQIRDQALAVSGLLSPKTHGPSVMPPQPPDLWKTPYNALEWVTSEGEDRYRRGVYTFMRRTVPYPTMLAFDAPTREVCVSRRIRTNTPLQALVTLNDPVFHEAARALARRMIEEGGTTPESRLRRGYRLTLLKAPAPEAVDRLLVLYRAAYEQYGEPSVVRPAAVGPDAGAAPEPTREFAALTAAASALLNLDAFLTKE